MGLTIGDIIDGKYRIVRLLGEGGMGAVYEGENARIHRRVAIKVLHGEVASNEEAMTRFEREAQAAGRIGSEHIVEVLDLGDLPGGERYMVMEFLEGEALADRIERGRIAPRDIALLMVDMLEGLKAAHAAGIIHRDLKPDNVFLLSNRGGKKDFVKIVDFGISKFNTMGGEFSMTRTGAVMGTPYYMAPEQAKGGKAVDHRVDLYAVGVILYQAVVGHVPFQAETFNELLFKIVLETPPPLEEQVPGIDSSFVAIVNRGMARDPDQRFPSAVEFQNALKDWLGGAAVSAGKTVHVGTPQSFDKTALPGPGMQTPFGQTPAQGTSQGQGTAQARGASPAQGASQGVLTTPGAWENENTSAGIPVKKGPPLGLIFGALVGVAAIVGATIALSGGGEDADPDDAAAAVDTEAATAASEKADTERTQALQALEEERAKAEEARKKAEEARALAEKNQNDLDAQKRAAEAARAAETQEKAAADLRRNAAPRPAAARPQPAPAPAPAPAPGPAPAKSGGRIITTDL
jgi:hypothetical protein